MKLHVRIAIALAIVLLVACSGCTNAPETPPATPAPTAAIATPAPAPVVTTATPEPLRTLPPEQVVDLQLNKDRTYSDITLHYNGGRGLPFVQKIMMRVTRSDGTVEEQYMRDGKKPQQGDEIVIRGTRGSDRCEVYVTSSGTVYKVKDESLIIGGMY
ncbi:MAG: hypothetical protein OS112_10530 [Methanoregula sp.]|nr:MAG: hypothetical protein OS112_10530 [Methanoregula sp.]